MTEGVLNMGAVLRELDFGNGKTSVLFENGVQVLYDHGKYVDDVPGSWGEREINAWFEGIEKGKEAGTAIIAKLEAELEQVKRERDAAANDMRQFTMDWWEDGERFPCRYCTYADENNCRWKIEHPGDTKGCFGKYFKWRGVKEG